MHSLSQAHPIRTVGRWGGWRSGENPTLPCRLSQLVNEAEGDGRKELPAVCQEMLEGKPNTILCFLVLSPLHRCLVCSYNVPRYSWSG
jgi:hypothetical protein